MKWKDLTQTSSVSCCVDNQFFMAWKSRGIQFLLLVGIQFYCQIYEKLTQIYMHAHMHTHTHPWKQTMLRKTNTITSPERKSRLRTKLLDVLVLSLTAAQSAGTYPCGGFLVNHVISHKHTRTQAHSHTSYPWMCIHQTMVPLGQTQVRFITPSGKASIHQLVVMFTSLEVHSGGLLFLKIRVISNDEGYSVPTWKP